MEREVDEVRAFVWRRRARFLVQCLLVASTGVGLYWGYVSLGRRLKPTEEILIDEPRAFLRSGQGAITAAADPWRGFLAGPLVAYTTELRRALKQGNGQVAPEAALLVREARESMEEAAVFDPALREWIKAFVELSASPLEGQAPRVSALELQLNELMAQRGLPFQLSLRVVRDPVAHLCARTHETVSGAVFEVGGKQIPVTFLDRVDRSSLFRDPDPARGSSGDAVVYLRPVMAAVQGRLFPALHEQGSFRLTRAEIPPGVADLEKDLGSLVFAQLKDTMTQQGLSGGWDVLEQASQAVEARNRLHREIAARNPYQSVLLEPTTLRLGWEGRAWLEELRPYVIQSQINVSLSELERLGKQEELLPAHVEKMAPLLQALLRDEVRLSALAELRRVEFQGVPLLEGSPMMTLGSPIPPEELSGRIAGRLTRLVEKPGSCAAEIAHLTADVLEPPGASDAFFVLEQLSAHLLNGQPLELASLPQSVRMLASTPCETLAASARAVYVPLLGPYLPITEAVKVADAQVSSSATGAP